MTICELRHEFSKVLDRVRYQGERVTIVRHTTPYAVLVSVEDAAILESLQVVEVKKADA